MTQPPLHLKLHSYLIQFDLGEIVNSKFLVEKFNITIGLLWMLIPLSNNYQNLILEFAYNCYNP